MKIKPAEKMAPTPGPWQLHLDGLAVFGAAPDRQQVADLEVCSPNIAMRERYANARLIAAAPDLLAALENIEKYSHIETREYRFAYNSPCGKALRAAIAKAE